MLPLQPAVHAKKSVRLCITLTHACTCHLHHGSNPLSPTGETFVGVLARPVIIGTCTAYCAQTGRAVCCSVVQRDGLPVQTAPRISNAGCGVGRSLHDACLDILLGKGQSTGGLMLYAYPASPLNLVWEVAWVAHDELCLGCLSLGGHTHSNAVLVRDLDVRLGEHVCASIHCAQPGKGLHASKTRSRQQASTTFPRVAQHS